MIIIFIISAYLCTAWCSFQINNPKCNDMAFIMHFYSVITFQELEEFQ